MRKKDTVPSCRECNSILGNRLFQSIGDRAAYLVGRLESRYKKLLSTPSWTEDELAELGRTLRVDVEGALSEKKAVQNRIDHCAHGSCVSPTPEEVWEEQNERLGDL